jgi:hypothetical protein
MPPKGCQQPRSKRYAGMLDSIKQQREGVKKLLVDLRNSKTNEDRQRSSHEERQDARCEGPDGSGRSQAEKQFTEALMIFSADEMGAKRARATPFER